MGEYADERLAHLHPEVFGNGCQRRYRRQPPGEIWDMNEVSIVDEPVDEPESVECDTIGITTNHDKGGG